MITRRPEVEPVKLIFGLVGRPPTPLHVVTNPRPRLETTRTFARIEVASAGRPSLARPETVIDLLFPIFPLGLPARSVTESERVSRTVLLRSKKMEPSPAESRNSDREEVAAPLALTIAGDTWLTIEPERDPSTKNRRSDIGVVTFSLRSLLTYTPKSSQLDMNRESKTIVVKSQPQEMTMNLRNCESDIRTFLVTAETDLYWVPSLVPHETGNLAHRS